jgi:TIR domain
MSDIFISYASADKAKAELLAKAFSQQGWSVWWDRQIPPGKSFDEVIEQALSSARCVIVFWSKDSVSSRWVKTEAAEAAAKGILVPALIDNVQIPLEFKRIEAANLTDWQGKSPHIEFDQLLKTIAIILNENTPPSSNMNQFLTDSINQSNHWWKKLFEKRVTIVFLIFLAGVTFFMQNNPLFESASSTTADSKYISPQIIEDQSSRSDTSPEPVTQFSKVESSVKLDKRINLLAPENGAQLLVASSDDWATTIDGKEDFSQISYGLGKEAVYGFKGEQAATFDTFTMLMSETESYNIKTFELQAGNDSPTGSFKSIGKFESQNVKLFKTPYQIFKFPPVTARYIKFR